MWARLARPKTNSRSSDEPFVRPELKKWGIYPGQLTPAEDPEPAENPARPPYDTHFHPGQHKQRRKRRVKKPRRTVRRKPKKKAQHNDLVVRPASTFRSIHAIPEGDGNDDSDSSNSEDDNVGTNEYLSAPPKRKTFVPGKKVPVQPRSVRKKGIRYFPSYTRWMLYLAGLSECRLLMATHNFECYPLALVPSLNRVAHWPTIFSTDIPSHGGVINATQNPNRRACMSQESTVSATIAS